MAAASDNRLQEFLRQFDAAQKNHKQYVDKWRHYERVYEGDVDPSKDAETRSRLRIPWVQQQVDAMEPRIIEPDPPVSYKAVELDDVRKAQVLADLVRQNLYADSFVAKQPLWIKDGTVKSFAVAKVVWDREEREVEVRRKPTIADALTRKAPLEKRKVVTRNRAAVKYVDPEDFLWDPATTGALNWSYVFHISWLTIPQIESRVEAGAYEPSDPKWKDALQSLVDGNEQRGVWESGDEAMVRRGDRFAMVERWHVDGTLMTVCGKVVFRDGKSPFEFSQYGILPFVTWSSRPLANSPVGRSECKSVDHLQRAIWTTDNQRIDAVSLALNNVLIMDPNIQGARNVQFRPGQKIFATNGQRIEQLQLQPNTRPAFEETQAYLSAIQQMTGVSPLWSGADGGSGISETATGATIQDEAANTTMRVKKMHFRMFCAGVIQRVAMLSRQYLSEQELARIVGEANVGDLTMEPHDLPLMLDVIPEGLNESLNKNNERAQISEYLNVAAGLQGVPMADGTVFDVKPALVKQAELYGLRALDAFRPAPPMPVEPGAEQVPG